MVSGLVIGIIFAFLLKRSRFCPTGTIRDIYLEKKYYNALLIFAVIFTQGFIYHILVQFELIPAPVPLFFSVVAIGIGSFMFGFGAILTNGCVTATLLKSGDGRTIGLISLVTFLASAYVAIETKLNVIVLKLNNLVVIDDTLLKSLPVSPIIISGVIAVVLYVAMYKYYISHKPKFKLPSRYTGLKHILLEKVWSKEITVVLIGALMAIGFYFSNLNGRDGGFGIPAPLLSWVNLVIPVDNTSVG